MSAGLILTVVFLIFSRPLLMAFGASEETIGYAVQYMKIYALGTVFVELALGLNAFITAQGFASVAMVSVLIGAVANMILDAVLILGLGMGVAGAALATIISQGLSAPVGGAVPSGQEDRPAHPAGEPGAGLEALWAVPGSGPVSLYHAVHGGRYLCVLQRLPPALRRGFGGGSHDHPGQRDAVFHAAPSGPDPGGAAIISYNFGAKNAGG